MATLHGHEESWLEVEDVYNLSFLASGDDEVPGSIALEVPAGTAVLFDRRVWHSASRNFSEHTRKGAPPPGLRGVACVLTVRRFNTQ